MYPNVRQTIVVPSNKKLVNNKVLSIKNATVIYMPDGSSYRDRNKKIVELSEYVEAFWNGAKFRSGTFMTINIAKRAGKWRHTTNIK